MRPRRAPIEVDEQRFLRMVEIAATTLDLPADMIVKPPRGTGTHRFAHLRQELWLVARDKGIRYEAISNVCGADRGDVHHGVKSALARYDRGQAVLVDILGEAL